MVNPEKQRSSNDRHIDDADQISNGDGSVNELSSNNNGTSTSGNPSITGRLMEVLLEDGDGDLLLQPSHGEEGVFQWLMALDLQVMGACRADERLKPLLKLNVSTGATEDRLLALLSQHFEPPEVGMLAICLCVPLVSIRVGKVNKQGNHLFPTSARGNLNLTLLPTSNLRITYNGDDGSMETLATLNFGDQCSGVEIEEISADKSGRSFFVKKNPAGEISYFWYSEKSKLLGGELLRKMKDLLRQKPSLVELTRISQSRLTYFAIHLRAHLAGSVMNSDQARYVLSAVPCLNDSVNSSHSPLTSLDTSYFPQNGSQGSKTHPMKQGNHSPSSSSSKEGLPRSLSSLSNKEKMRQKGESYISGVDSLNVASPNCSYTPSLNCLMKTSFSETTETDVFPPLSFLDVVEKSTNLYLSGPEAQVPFSSTSCFSPHYCWCPPVASARQYSIGTPQLPISITESVSLPPLSSFLSTSKPLKQYEPPIGFSTLLPESLVSLPFKPNSQKIPTFTPLICDPIVHIPVIDVCSSGQGYLVSAGPAISTVISHFNPSLVEPLIPDAESVLEKGARETLRILISSSTQPNPQLLDVLPSVLTGSKDNSFVALGSKGFYSTTRNVGANGNSMTTVVLASVAEKSMGGSIGRSYVRGDDLGCKIEKTSGSGVSSSDDLCSNFREN